MAVFSIGKISKLTGLTTKTIRFYEDEGLLKKVSRSQNGYRQFSSQNLDELQVIHFARNLGLPLSEIKKLLRHPEFLEEYLKKLIKENNNQIDKLTKTQKNLQSLQKELQTSKVTCTGDDYCCNIFYQILKTKTKGGENNDLQQR